MTNFVKQFNSYISNKIYHQKENLAREKANDAITLTPIGDLLYVFVYDVPIYTFKNTDTVEYVMTTINSIRESYTLKLLHLNINGK